MSNVLFRIENTGMEDEITILKEIDKHKDRIMGSVTHVILHFYIYKYTYLIFSFVFLFYVEIGFKDSFECN